MTTDEGRIRERLGEALDRILAVFLLAGGVPDDIRLDETIDAIHGADVGIGEARRTLSRCLNSCRRTLDSTGHGDLFFRIEEAANDLAARCLEAGVRAGLTAGCSSR